MDEKAWEVISAESDRVGNTTFPCSVAAYSYILYSVVKQKTVTKNWIHPT